MKALLHAGEGRYASAADVADALERYVEPDASVRGAARSAAAAAATYSAASSTVSETTASSGSALRRAVPIAAAADLAAGAGVAAADGAGASASLGRGNYSADAYASRRGPVDRFNEDAEYEASNAYSPEPERPRRPVRRPSQLDDETEQVGASPWAWIAGVLLVMVIVVIAFIVFTLASKSPQAPIYAPNLMYESYTQAQAQAQRDGLNVIVQFTPNTTTQADGTVVAQDPAAATEMHAGDTITITVVTGQKTVTVPNIVGMTETDALSALTGVGLQAGVVTNAYDPAIPAGQIISSNPHSGIPVLANSLVDYVLSQGPSPTATPSPSPSPTPSPSPSPTPTPAPTPTPTPAPTPTPTHSPTPAPSPSPPPGP
jgi:hypothetical protein